MFYISVYLKGHNKQKALLHLLANWFEEACTPKDKPLKKKKIPLDFIFFFSYLMPLIINSMYFPYPIQGGKKTLSVAFHTKTHFKSYAYKESIKKKKGQRNMLIGLKFKAPIKWTLSWVWGYRASSGDGKRNYAAWGPKFMSVADSDEIGTEGITSGLLQREGGGVALVFSCDLEVSRGQAGQSRV